jgi:protein subunit release factor B
MAKSNATAIRLTARGAPNSSKSKKQKMPAKKKSKTSKRTVIEPHKGDRRYARRNKEGEFKKQVNVGRSLAADRKRKAKTKVKKGQGDRGDVKK